MDTLDIALRLSAASIVGVVLGLNRDLHGKPTGVRTLGVLCLGSALAVLSIHAVTGSDASRVIQGVVRRLSALHPTPRLGSTIRVYGPAQIALGHVSTGAGSTPIRH